MVRSGRANARSPHRLGVFAWASNESLFQPMSARCSPARLPARTIAQSFLGGLLAIGAVGYLTASSGVRWSWLIWGQLCAALSFPDSPFSAASKRDRRSLLTSLIGLAFLACSVHRGGRWLLARSQRYCPHALDRTVHPPADQNPVIVDALDAWLAIPANADLAGRRHPGGGWRWSSQHAVRLRSTALLL